MTTITKPTPGRDVWYQTDGRNFDYYLPAKVVVTKDNLVPEAVEQGLIPGLSSPAHVHLWVPGGKEPYREFDVPYSAEGKPRSWRWPETTFEVVKVPEPDTDPAPFSVDVSVEAVPGRLDRIVRVALDDFFPLTTARRTGWRLERRKGSKVYLEDIARLVVGGLRSRFERELWDRVLPAVREELGLE